MDVNKDNLVEELECLKKRIVILEDIIKCDKQWIEQIRIDIYTRIDILEDTIKCDKQWMEKIRSDIYKQMDENHDQAGKLFQEKHEMIMAEHQSILDIVRFQMLIYYKGKNVANELAEVINYIETNSIRMIPYNWFDEYMAKDISIEKEGEWLYTLYFGKKIYFPKSYSKKEARNYFRILLAEQDDMSPHRYFDSIYEIPDGSIFIDVGAAEGLIGISNIDKVKKLILIECEPKWIEALKKTCEPYADKIEIIDKMASDTVSDTEITLFDLTKEPDIYTIKIDVEGYEKKVLAGIELDKLKKNSKIAVCAYHHQDDQAMIELYCKEKKLDYGLSKGYVLSTWGGYKEPFVRRGIVRISI